MGLIIRRPLSAGELLDLSFAVAKRHFWSLLGLGGLPLGIAMLLDHVVRLAGAEEVRGWATFLVATALSGIAESRMVVGAWQVLHDRPIGPSQARGLVRSRLLPMVVGYTLKWALVIVGLTVFLVPGIFLLLWWFAVPAVTVLEGRGLRDSFRRSRALARGHMRRLLATVGLFDLVWMATSIALGMMYMDAATGERPFWTDVVSWTLTVLLFPVRSTLVATVYTEIRVRKEGYDLEAAAADLAVAHDRSAS